MANYDPNILIQNIDALMMNKKLTQRELAKVLGMSQPNVSKALNTNDKKSFTLDQVVGIAKYFDVPVDVLVGNHPKTSPDVNPLSIAAFITKIVEQNYAKFTLFKKEETVYELDDDGYKIEPEYKGKKQEISYPAIYFPSYTEPIHDSEIIEATQFGNKTKMLPLNEFLQQFKDIFKFYQDGAIPDSAYKLVIDGLISRLKKD